MIIQAVHVLENSKKEEANYVRIDTFAKHQGWNKTTTQSSIDVPMMKEFLQLQSTHDVKAGRFSSRIATSSIENSKQLFGSNNYQKKTQICSHRKLIIVQ